MSSGSSSWVIGSPHQQDDRRRPTAGRRRRAGRGTWVSRSRAIVDSTTPIATATGEHPARGTTGQSSQGAARSTGTASRTTRAPKSEQLQRRAVEDHAERRAAVVEHHDLVDHGQLEVGVRVVERDAAVLGEQDDEPAQQDQRERGTRRRPSASQTSRRACPTATATPTSLARTSRPRNSAGSARQAKVTSRAAPIPSNAEPVSRAAGDGEEPAQAQQVRRTGSKSPVERRPGGRPATNGTSEHRERRRHQRRPPARPGTPRSSSC